MSNSTPNSEQQHPQANITAPYEEFGVQLDNSSSNSSQQRRNHNDNYTPRRFNEQQTAAVDLQYLVQQPQRRSISRQSNNNNNNSTAAQTSPPGSNDDMNASSHQQQQNQRNYSTMSSYANPPMLSGPRRNNNNDHGSGGNRSTNTGGINMSTYEHFRNMVEVSSRSSSSNRQQFEDFSSVASFEGSSRSGSIDLPAPAVTTGTTNNSTIRRGSRSPPNNHTNNSYNNYNRAGGNARSNPPQPYQRSPATSSNVASTGTSTQSSSSRLDSQQQRVVPFTSNAVSASSPTASGNGGASNFPATATTSSSLPPPPPPTTTANTGTNTPTGMAPLLSQSPPTRQQQQLSVLSVAHQHPMLFTYNQLFSSIPRPTSASPGGSSSITVFDSRAADRVYATASGSSPIVAHHHYHHHGGGGGNATSNITASSSARPQFRSKAVCQLSCKYCSNKVCKRGMKAILLADMAVELFSTDMPPAGVSLVNEDYQTRKCYCRIRDVACLGCGNVIGYHVTQPCQSCMDACNNGHFWMFHVDHVDCTERMNASGTKTLLWANLGRPDNDVEKVEGYEGMCR